MPVSGSLVHLHQGIYARGRFERRGALPILGPEVDSFYVTGANFGHPKSFSDNTPFQDLSNFSVLNYINDVSGTQEYPAILGNVNIPDPSQMDGVIEPLTIRAKLAGTSVEAPHVAHDIRGALQEGNEDYMFRVDRVMQQYPTSHPTVVVPYIDSGETFGTHLTTSVKLPGYTSGLSRIVKPFSDEDRLVKSDVSSTITGNDVLAALAAMNPDQQDFIAQSHRSAGSGFTYDKTPTGTDSIAYGGLKK